MTVSTGSVIVLKPTTQHRRFLKLLYFSSQVKDLDVDNIDANQGLGSIISEAIPVIYVTCSRRLIFYQKPHQSAIAVIDAYGG